MSKSIGAIGEGGGSGIIWHPSTRHPDHLLHQDQMPGCTLHPACIHQEVCCGNGLVPLDSMSSRAGHGVYGRSEEGGIRRELNLGVWGGGPTTTGAVLRPQCAAPVMLSSPAACCAVLWPPWLAGSPAAQC